MSLSADNKAISIPTQHYVGFSKRQEEEIPLGFMVPDGEDAGAKKRKATVDSWATRTANTIDSMSFENEPLIGFKLGRNIRHGGYGWGQGNVKWRIEDPRGFELEISSPNLAQIMGCTVIENGEILEACVWGRLKSENILLPVSSDVYKAATANTERMNTKASLKDLKVGDHVTMHNGDEGEYMGMFFLVDTDRYSEERQVKLATKKKFVLRRKREGDDVFIAIASPKLSAIDPRDEKSTTDNEGIINDLIRSGIVFANSSYTCAVSADAAFESGPTFELRSYKTLDEANDAEGSDRYRREIFGSHADRFGIYNQHSGWGKQGTVFTAIDKQALVESAKVKHVINMHGSGLFARSSYDSFEVPKGDTIEWHRLFAHFVTRNGYKVQIIF